MDKAVFQIKGMSCTGCAMRLARVIGKMDGVARADVDFETNRLQVEYDAGRTDLVKIADQAEAIGFDASPIA